jgi:cytochrome c-type biogenesis protein CcmH/NrfG
MGSANVPEGLVKKEVMIIAALVALVVGFMGGVIFSSFKAPAQPATVAQGKAPQPAAGQPQAGLTSEQAAQIFALEEEVKANPNNGAAWTQLGNFSFDTDRPSRAIEAYNKSLELNQGQPEVWTDLGVMYRRNRQFKEALAAFEQALNLRPGLEQALFNKGVVLVYDLGDKAGGVKAWQQLVAANPNAQAPNGQRLTDMIASVK